MRFATALLIAGALPLSSQETPVIRVTTRMVQVNVIVRDKKGPIANLKKEDFALTEQGKPREIASFSVTKAGSANALQGSVKLPPNIYSNQLDRSAAVANNVTVILLDGLNTSLPDQVLGRKAVIKYLETMRREDRIALYALGNTLRVLHDFTGDYDQLRAAVERSKGENSARLAASEPDAVISEDPSIDEFLNAANQKISDFNTIERVRRTIEALEVIARHVGGVPGRKNLIWISGSFPFAIGLDDPIGTTNERRTFNEEVQRATRRLNDANLAVYPVDTRGLDVPLALTSAAPSRILTTPAPPPRIDMRPKGIDTLQEIAARTGGVAFFNTNDVKGAIQKAVEDSEVTYTLGFYPASDDLDGKFHELKVKVSRPGIEVRHRKGYLALGELQRSDKQMLDDMKSASASPLDLTELLVSIRADVVNEPKKGMLQLTVLVDAHDLQVDQKDGKRSGKGHLLIMQVGAGQKILSSLEESLSITFTEANYQTFLQRGLMIARRIDPVAGVQQVRVLILDRLSGRIGSLRMPVGQLIASGAKPTPPK